MECEEKNVNNQIKKCSKCGNELKEGQLFCPNCGQKVDLNANVANEINKNKDNTNNKRILVIISVAILVCIIAIIALMRPSVDEITLNENSIKIKPGVTETITYTIKPEKSSKTKVKWSTSDANIAEVDKDGKITGKADGECVITVKAGNKTADLNVTVKSSPDFKEIYNKYCKSTWATVGSDGSYLKIDTNPYNIDEYSDYEALAAIFLVNDELELPESLGDSMMSTVALMGRLTETFEEQGVIVSWSYHPDNGLEVSYKEIN